VPCLGLMWF